ncbi:MAG TPA: polyprenol monophosphomannose synthase [Candidatus Limnocylindrales bacterium]
MATDRSVWVVLPTYNEVDNIGPISEAVLGALPDAHVLIADDNSPDGTGAAADALAAADPRIHVLHRPGKQGIGPAYVAGFREAMRQGAEILVQMDADFSHPVRFLPGLVAPILDGRADVVLGSRYVPGGRIPRWSLPRRFISRGGCLFAQVLLWLPYRDLTGGFKAIHRDVLERIDLDSIHAGGYAFQIETTFRAHRAGARMEQLPFTFEERREGQSKMSGAIVVEALKVVLALRFAAFSGAIPVRKPVA